MIQAPLGAYDIILKVGFAKTMATHTCRVLGWRSKGQRKEPSPGQCERSKHVQYPANLVIYILQEHRRNKEVPVILRMIQNRQTISTQIWYNSERQRQVRRPRSRRKVRVLNCWTRNDTRVEQGRQCTYKLNIEVHSSNHYCSVKATSITYSECESVALGIQREMRMRRIAICGLPGSIICLHHLINGTIFKKQMSTKMCVLIFCTTFVWNIFHYDKKWARYY
jgi:hypothetical protein